MLPAIFLSSFSIKFPLVYAIIPAQESANCISTIQSEEIWVNWLYKGDKPYNLMTVNATCFYLLNWVFMVTNIYLLYRIRNVKDRFQTYYECRILMLAYTCATYLQSFFYFAGSFNDCIPENKTFGFIEQNSALLCYVVIMLRDVALILIMIIFLRPCRKSLNEQHLFQI